MTLVVSGRSEEVQGALVTPPFFKDRTLQPELGRFLIDADYESARPIPIVLSNELWKRVFHAQPWVIGARVELDGNAALVVGVTSPGFALGAMEKFWIPQPNGRKSSSGIK